MGPEESLLVFRLVAAILKLGNLDFVPTTNMDGTEGCGISNDYELYEVCDVLDCDLEILRSALVTRTIEAGHEYLMTDLSAGEAANGRDSLCRALYGRLFTWLVNRINEAVKVKTPQRHKAVGILDLYGFEASAQNGFEQLLINYANERLAALVAEWGLGREQAEYAAEGVEWAPIDHFDNTVICELIEKANSGLLSALDEVALRRNAQVVAAGSVCPNLDLLSSVDAGDSDSTISTTVPPVVVPPPHAPKRPSSGSMFIQRLSEVFGDRHPHLEVLKRSESAKEELPNKRNGSSQTRCSLFQSETFCRNGQVRCEGLCHQELGLLGQGLVHGHVRLWTPTCSKYCSPKVRPK